MHNGFSAEPRCGLPANGQGGKAGVQSVCLSVCLADAGGNTAAVVDVIVILPRPRPQLLSAWTILRVPARPAHALRTADFASTADEGSQSLEELVVIIRYKINLVIYTIQRKGV